MLFSSSLLYIKFTFEREPEGSDQLSHWAVRDSGVPQKGKTWSKDHQYVSNQVSSGVFAVNFARPQEQIRMFRIIEGDHAELQCHL